MMYRYINQSSLKSYMKWLYILYIPIKSLKRFSKQIVTNINRAILVASLKTKKVIVSNNVILSTKTIFESNNLIRSNSNISGSYIGMGTYISENCKLPHSLIGRFCSIGNNVKVIIGKHPIDTFVSTHPAFFSTANQAGFTFVNKNKFTELEYSDESKKFYIEIGNDVWIGDNVLILQGIKIGDGAIIGSGAIVTKNIEPYSINVGTPAKIIKYRFSKDEIAKLLKTKWWDWDFSTIKARSESFDNISKFISLQTK